MKELLHIPEEMVTEYQEKLRGGEGTVTIKHLFTKSELKGKTRLIAEVTVPVGGSIGYHRHDNEEEIFYFISGIGEVDDDGQQKKVKPGDAMLTGGGHGHSVKNTGAEPLVILAAVLLYI